MPIDHFQAQRFGRLELLAKQAVEGFITGLHKSPYHGFSVEFAEHQAYNTGESTRHIDWKLYGRTDKMFVKRFEEETNLRCQICIDQSGSMFYPKVENDKSLNKVRFSIQASAALIYLMRSQRDAVGVSLFSDGLEWSSPVKSSSVHHNFLFNQLEELYDKTEGSGHSNIIESLHAIAEKVHKRSLVVIFSDFLDELYRDGSDQTKLFEALQHLRYNKHEVVLFHVFDKRTEVDLDLGNQPHTFIDMETGEKVKVRPNEVKQSYHQERRRMIDEVKLKCRQFNIDWIETDISEGFKRVLDRFLAKRARMV
ncbi:MAG: DUF58 domain-containing protein [Salibacteraceae bacterium]